MWMSLHQYLHVLQLKKVSGLNLFLLLWLMLHLMISPDSYFHMWLHLFCFLFCASLMKLHAVEWWLSAAQTLVWKDVYSNRQQPRSSYSHSGQCLHFSPIFYSRCKHRTSPVCCAHALSCAIVSLHRRAWACAWGPPCERKKKKKGKQKPPDGRCSVPLVLPPGNFGSSVNGRFFFCQTDSQLWLEAKSSFWPSASCPHVTKVKCIVSPWNTKNAAACMIYRFH